MKDLPQLSQLGLFDEVILTQEQEIENEMELPKHAVLVPYELGDMVRILNEADEENEPEAFYYLRDFEKKRGIVEKVTLKPNLQYQIRFGDTLAFVYHHELTI